MVFGFGKKKEVIGTTGTTGSSDHNNMDEKHTFGGNGYYDGFAPGNAEEGGHGAAPRKMSRIDQPRTKSIMGSVAGRGGVEDDASDPSTSVAKQMELESANEIQYRTCSWQKVRLSSPASSALSRFSCCDCAIGF